VGKGRPVNKESLRISECICENALAVIVDPFRNRSKEMAHSDLPPIVSCTSRNLSQAYCGATASGSGGR
jgi:hypothetical protein